MYSYDRRKVARRSLADFDTLQDTLKTAQETVQVATKYVRDRDDFYRFLQVDPDLGNAKTLLATAARIVKELPAALAATNQLDDAIDAYARTTRRGMPRDREEIGSSDIDQKFLKDLQRRAQPLSKTFSDLSQLATNAPTGFDVEDPYDSPRVAAINVLATRLDELSIEITFNESEYVSFLDGIEDTLVEAINRGPT